MPEEQVWAVIDQLLGRLEELHAQGKCHRSFSLSTVGIDASGELEIAATDAALSISDLVRLHAPLPSTLRHEFELVIPAHSNDAAIALANAGFSGDGISLDLFQVAVLTIRLIFDVEGEKFLSSPCLQETLSPDLRQMLRQLLAAEKQEPSQARCFRALLPGAIVFSPEATSASHSMGRIEEEAPSILATEDTLLETEADSPRMSSTSCEHPVAMIESEPLSTGTGDSTIAPLVSPTTSLSGRIEDAPKSNSRYQTIVIGIVLFVVALLGGYFALSVIFG